MRIQRITHDGLNNHVTQAAILVNVGGVIPPLGYHVSLLALTTARERLDYSNVGF